MVGRPDGGHQRQPDSKVGMSVLSYYVLASLPNASACQVAVDGKLAFPWPGLDVGSGFHAPAAQSATTSYAPVVPHPSVAGSYVYPADSITTPILIVGPTAVLIGVPQAVIFPGSLP